MKKTGQAKKGEMLFFTICPGAGIDPAKNRTLVPHNFTISHENLEASTTASIPKFKFEGVLFSTNCAFNEPFDGHIIKRHSELQIKSVEIQLVRVETFEGKT